jgi:hypothetical protein
MFHDERTFFSLLAVNAAGCLPFSVKIKDAQLPKYGKAAAA